ncbi:MAG TPA: Vps62-related protein [Ilumatobacteraceae bacterium]
MIERGSRLALATILLGTTLALVPAARAHAAAGDNSAAQELADRHAPIVMLRTQAQACDSDGEPFVPMNVDLVLDNQQVALRQVGNGDPTVMRGPGAADLSNLGEGFYLDFPGDSLRPGCLYEQDNNRFNAEQPAVVYAHIVQQADRPDLLVLQYWLFWYYNDWNNKHEGDWEFIQLLFDASTVEQALTKEPVSVGYAQHEGGERAGWGDAKVKRDGERPVLYTSQRSHASYYSPELYLGRSGSEGFGCDSTRAPSTRVDPKVVLLPSEVDNPGDPLAWINFEGRWGERHSGPNNGPTGPNTKPQWTQPVTWQDGLRDDSFVVPAGNTRGVELLDTFCGVVEWGSVQYIHFVASPGRMLLVVAAIVALLLFLARRTSWEIVDPMPLVRRRRLGQIFRVASRQIKACPGTFAATAGLALPVVGVALLIGAVARRLPFLGDLVEVSDSDGTDGRWLVATIIATTLVTLAFVVISAAVAWIIGGPQVRPSARDAARAVSARLGGLVVAVLIAAAVLGVLAVIVIGVPIAVWLFVRWQFTPQVVLLEGEGGRRALARGDRLVRKRWLHTALATLLVWALMAGVGMVVGLVLLIFFTGLPLWVLSAVIALCDVLVMPYGALVLTYLYGDAVASQRSPDLAEADLSVAVGGDRG